MSCKILSRRKLQIGAEFVGENLRRLRKNHATSFPSDPLHHLKPILTRPDSLSPARNFPPPGADQAEALIRRFILLSTEPSRRGWGRKREISIDCPFKGF
jgi:hypothetical protein